MGLNALNLQAQAHKLAAFLRDAAQAGDVTVEIQGQLGGGAIQQNWVVATEIKDGKRAGKFDAVLRTDAPSGVPESRSRPEEFALLSVAHRLGMIVPEPLWCEPSGEVLGRPFYLMRRAAGSADPRKLRELEPEAGDALARQLGGELAKLHKLTPDAAPPELDFLARPPGDLVAARVAAYRKQLDQHPEPRPVLEWSINWMEENAPSPGATTLCHRDFRTGNYLVEDGKATAILDFEFAGWSDPAEDLGWFCARCWRFGAMGSREADRDAGGIGRRQAFYDGYCAISGKPVDVARVAFWEMVAPIRWALIALQQGERHLSGQERSLNLALTGLRAVECEYDLLLDLSRMNKES